MAGLPHFQPRAKRVIYLFQSGGPAQMDLFDYKPHLRDRAGQEVPKSVYPDERKTTMTSAQSSFAVAPSIFKFSQQGEAGTWMSELLPHTGQVADELCVIRSLHTDAINHDPAITLLQTGSQIAGRPSIGAWMSYGLGSESADLPAFVALSSRGAAKADQPLYDRLWGSGFLPTKYQGVKFRNQGDPVLDLADPAGRRSPTRRLWLDHLARLDGLKHEQTGDPEIQTRIAQYELAFRMQMSVPELTAFASEPQHILDAYGPDVAKQGTYAYNCLLARRLAERGVQVRPIVSPGLGPAQQLAETNQEPVRRDRSADGGAAARPEAARHAGRHARRLGRRVRTHDLLARQADRVELRPRPSSGMLHDVAGRRRHPRRHELWPERRLQRQCGRKRRPRARPSRHACCTC